MNDIPFIYTHTNDTHAHKPMFALDNRASLSTMEHFFSIHSIFEVYVFFMFSL